MEQPMSINVTQYAGGGTTVGATTSTIVEFGVPDNSWGTARFTCVAANTANNQVARYVIEANFWKGTGNVTVTGTGVVSSLLAFLLSSVTVDANGPFVRLRGTGIVGATLQWAGNGDFVMYSDP